MNHTEKNPPSWHPGRWYAYIFLVCVAIIGFLGMYLESSYRSIEIKEKEKIANALNVSAANANSVFRSTFFSLGKVENYLQKTSQHGRQQASSSMHSEIRNLLIQEVAVIPGVISMSVLDHNGKWIISSRFKDLPQLPVNPERPIWKAALKTQQNDHFLLDSSKSPAFGIPSLVLGRPVIDHDGKMLSIVIAFIAEESLQQIFGAILTEGQSVFITHPDGGGLFALPQGEPSIPEWIHPKWLNALKKDSRTFDAMDEHGQRWTVSMLHSSDQKTDLVYTMLTPKNKIVEQWWVIGKTVALAGVACLLILVFFSELWIRERKRLYFKTKDLASKNSQLHHIISHDTASELLNANGLEKELSKLGADQQPVAIHVIGAERLQALSDTINSGIDDQLINQISRRLTSCLGERDIAARLATEEFCVVQHEGDANAMAETIAMQLGNDTYILGDRTIILPIAVGTALSENGTDWHQLLRDGRSAMERARTQGGGKFLKFEPSADRAIHEQLLLEQDFRAAIGTNQLYMMYQPIVHVATGKISGFESLMRWNSPGRGMVPPSIFIPMAERRGLLLPIDQMVERSPLLAASDWPEDVSVSINCPAFDFLDSGMAARLQAHLHRAGIKPRRCYIEVTESALLQDDEQVISVMRDVKALGVNLAIDDFGSGHASLSYLHRFPFDLIKIDRSFIQAMDKDAGAAAIVEATLTLSQRLGLDVVAEGVETPEQFLHLKKLGCTYVQGYLIAKPMNEEEVSSFIGNFNIHETLNRAQQA